MSLKIIEFEGEEYFVYADRREATAYLNGDPRYASAWNMSSTSDEAKDRALIWATRQIDAYSFSGEPSGIRVRRPSGPGGTLNDRNSTIQTTEFPRGGAVEIPLAVERACALQAGFVIANPSASSPRDPVSAPQRKKLVAGRTSIEFFEGRERPAPTLRAGQPDVRSLLAPFLSSPGVASPGSVAVEIGELDGGNGRVS